MKSKTLLYLTYAFVILIVAFLMSLILKQIRRSRNRSALANSNIAAFLRVIRSGESSQDDDRAYRMMYGGKLFSSFDDHPRQAFLSSWGWTDAAGAYQFMASVPGKVKTNTWDRIQAKLGLPDFSPESQDLAAIELLRERGVYDLILQGYIEEAINGSSRNTGANKEWASLPNNPYGQPAITMAKAISTFKQYGGTVA
ncbi:MAG TPA: glycoside hydrolase family 104 protein [Flavipsychrobacter sp.]|nr:glycoside hydrolase family 104 protein [Flavipsychrobacter sp.]